MTVNQKASKTYISQKENQFNIKKQMIMKVRKNKPIGILAIIGMLTLLVGCSKSIVNIYDGEDDEGIPGHPGKGHTLVTFNASIETLNVTRAMTLMKSGIKSHIYAYLPGATISGRERLYVQGIYVTSAPGILTGEDGYRMFLPNDTYNFYAVSDNLSTIPPSFTNGESDFLFNGIDYLWWGASEQDVSSSQINIPITFQHAGTQVVIEVEAGQGLVLNSLLFASITPPEPGATMQLATGVIPPATTYDRPDKMGVNGLTAQYIMLPLQTDEPMKLTLEILVNDETTSRTYNAEVPVPDGELKAGNSYVFKAIVDENTVSFPIVTVKNWTEVDETGKPLHPSQK